MTTLIEQYQDQIKGVVSCYDRVIITGTLPYLCYAEGMTGYLNKRHIRIFDYAKFAEPLRQLIRTNAETLAAAAGTKIKYVGSCDDRKEDIVARILKERGHHPGLVCILSAMEICDTYKPWHDKLSGKTYLTPDTSKCAHFYFYFIDELLGLCFVRVPTWCPFRLQFYFNGHNWLASLLKSNGIPFQMKDNALLHIEDFERAQTLADGMNAAQLQQRLDQYALQFCPAIREIGVSYHWSLTQVEYATDIIFKSASVLRLLFESLLRTAVFAVKSENVAMFLGRKLEPQYRDELGSRFNTRIEGHCLRHHMGPVSIKMYDKFGFILRIETTSNNVSFFKHYRKVEQRNGEQVFKVAPARKSIYSLHVLMSLMGSANHRYLQFLSTLGDRSAGMKNLNKVSQPTTVNGRRYSGFNFFSAGDQRLFETIVRGEFCISGLRNKDLCRLLGFPSAKISRFLNRLRAHGLLKRVGRTYKYYLTDLGRRVACTGLKLKEMVVIPELA